MNQTYIVKAGDTLYGISNQFGVTEEEFIEDLWKTFFKTVAIKERENLKCQRNFMPKRYWENMIEMEDKLWKEL